MEFGGVITSVPDDKNINACLHLKGYADDITECDLNIEILKEGRTKNNAGKGENSGSHIVFKNLFSSGSSKIEYLWKRVSFAN